MSKHNRIFRSSSLGDVGLSCAIQQIESSSSEKKKKRSPPRPAESSRTPEKPRRMSILTIGSPVLDRNNNEEAAADTRYGAFLESCHFCKRKINAHHDVFMCGHLRAFCSLDCRNIQIAIDEKDRRPSPKSTRITAGNGRNNPPPVRLFGA